MSYLFDACLGHLRERVLSAYPNEIERPGDHNNAGSPLLPDHSPEVADRRLCRSLCNNVCLWLNEALK